MECPMSDLIRFGVSMDSSLLEEFDKYIEERNYSNRSEALRDIIRSIFTEEEWKGNTTVAGAIVLKCRYGPGDLSSQLLAIQHSHRNVVISSLHVHLDETKCLRVIVVKGSAEQIQKMANEMQSLKGVYHCEVAKVIAG